MTKELAKQQKCLVFRNGLEIWIDREKAEKIEIDWVGGNLKGPFTIDGRTLNTADLSAVALPEDMEDFRRRKNGQYKCEKGTWHDRNEKCGCRNEEEVEKSKMWNNAVKGCGKCQNGWIFNNETNTMEKCDCVKNL